MSLLAGTCLFLGLLFLLFQRARTLLTYFQQEEYDAKRLVAAWARVRLFDLKASAATAIAVGLGAAGASGTLVMVLLALVFVAIGYFERSHRYKKALVMTERAARILRLALAALAVLSLAVFLHPVWAIAVLQAAPLAMIAANAVLKPFQARINARFQAEARDRLARMNPVRIGITGSFGKTTVKHMLAEILQASGPVFFSRGSINTVLGHTRHIRERLQWAHKYYVAEMGAYGIGSIRRLCDFIQPRYGIVTAVGDAHTERFGGLDAIAQAKSELATAVCARGGTVVLNAELLKYAPFRAIRETYGTQVVTVGYEDADVKITCRELDGGIWSIGLASADPRFPAITYELPLLGEHNVMNSALAVTLAMVIDPAISDRIALFTRDISQVPHRLQKIGAPGSALILDDAYNSNERGFISAVAAMGKLADQRGGRRILVTPGIAELGNEHDPVHERLGRVCAKNCDLICVVNPRRIPSFVRAAKSASAEVIEAATLADARAAIAPDLKERDVVLYENDLPDILEERRLL